MIRALPCSTQLQLFNTLVLGAVQYLLSILPLSPRLAGMIDSRVRTTARRIFGMPANTNNELVDLELPCTPFSTVSAMHQARMLLYLQLTPMPECLAARMVNFQLTARPRGHTLTTERYTPFATRVLRLIDDTCRTQGRGARVQPLAARPTPVNAARTHSAVTVFRRSAAYTTILRSLPGFASSRSRRHAQSATTALTRPPSVPAAAHLSTLYYAGNHASVADLGSAFWATPMSIAGPNCSGSFLAITTLNWRKTQAPATLRLGLRAFAHEPFTPRRHQWRSNTTADHPHDDGDDLIRRITHHSVQRACPLCDHGRVRRTDDGPWHLFLECHHIEVAAPRRRMLSSTPRMLRQLDALTTAAMERAGLLNPDEATDAVTARSALLEEILDDADWSSRDG